ncbi:MAG TPA: hypothetical protein VF950_18525 [Planctomycetota bacterium]
MECDKFVLEKLEGGDSPDFRAHRVACAGCARDVEELDDVRRLYHEATEEERWRGIVTMPAKRSAAAWMPVAAAAGVAIAVIVGLLRSSAPVTVDAPTSADAPAPFVRVHVLPWDREENRLARAMDDAWTRLEGLERSIR